MNTHVIKIGGENASDPRTSEWLANSGGNGEQIAVAISALRTRPLNTTNELLRARDAYTQGGMQAAIPILEHLFRIHMETLQSAGMYDRELEQRLRNLFISYFPLQLNLEESYLSQNPKIDQEQRFVGYGEVMSAHVLSHLLDTRYQVANTIINHNIGAQSGQSTLSEVLRDEVGARVNQGIVNNLVIVPGYVSVQDHSILDAYGRGYTDTMAERIAVGLSNLGHSPILHIQKQVPILSSNPNNISVAEPIENLSYWTAAEITGSHGANAQVLNEHTITAELAARDIPVWVYNPFEQDSTRSIISASGNLDSGIQFVDGRDHISTITISGFDMTGPGLLSRLTELFARQGVAIDSVSSSGTEVTFTTFSALSEYDNSELRRNLGQNLGNQYNVVIRNNLGIIYCVGDNLSGNPGLLERISGILAREGIDIECITQSRGQRAVTVGVSSENLTQGIRALHHFLIEERD